jgi:soluble lytic murein transglycosylase-like protein
MATLYVDVPATGLASPSNWGSRSQIKSMLERIWSNYGSYIKFASLNSKIPPKVITAFIAVESGGKADAGSAGHITQGLMQWNREYAKAQLERELEKGRMTPAERSKLADFGIKFDANGKTRTITNADQLKPELNILIGSIVLGQLIDNDWAKEGSKLRLDRVIAVYNAGAYGDTGKKARLGNYATPKALADSVNPITRSYIAKIVGRDGALDIIETDLNIG